LTTQIEINPVEAVRMAATAILEETKSGELGFDARAARLYQLNEMIVDLTPEQRNTPGMILLLDKLSDAFLHEVIKDPTPWKSRNQEYPILSAKMEERRTSKNVEETIALATYDSNKRKRSAPTRRVKTRHENYLANENTQSENKARKKRYDDFVKGRKSAITIMKVSIQSKECSGGKYLKTSVQ